jgi:two-component system sensor histidine kinase KdpD
MNKRVPEDFLKAAMEAEHQSTHGQLKIYLGAAPGVGKTYQMLTDALSLRSQGYDVVIGVVATHGREEVESIASAFEKIPLQAMTRENHTEYALNLQKVIQRAPGLVLIDEAAFSNPKGLLHPKRWQDILELLQHGMNVYTTLNIQHIESLNNVVTNLIGIPVYETVPDSFLEKADNIELIDLPSEELITRLKQGKIYVPADSQIAIHHFFKKKNLDALRELALRIVAEKVSLQVESPYSKSLSARLMYKQDALLVAIKCANNMPKLIRTAKRLSLRLNCTWYAVFVDTGAEKAQTDIQQYLQLAETLGARTQIIYSDNIFEAIEQFIENNHITQLVLGKSTKSWWQPVSRFELLARRLKDVGMYCIDIGTTDEKPGLVQHCVKKIPQDWSKVLILCGLFLGLELLFNERSFHLLLSNWKDWLWHSSQWLAILILVSTSLMYSKRKFEQVAILQQNNNFLMGFYQSINSVRGKEHILQVAYDYLSDQLKLNCMVFLPQRNSLALYLPKTSMALTDKEIAIVQWVYQSGQPAGQGTGNLIFSEAFFLPLKGHLKSLGVFRFENQYGELLSSLQRKNLTVCIQQLANMLDIEYQLEEEQWRKLSNLKQQIRDNLLKGFAKQLYQPFSHLLDKMPSQLEDSPYAVLLARLRSHLKVMTYFSDESLPINRSLQSMQDIIEHVLHAHRKDWRDWKVSWYVEANLPKVMVHLDLMTAVIENLMENIHQHSNAHEGVEVSLHRKNHILLVSIADFGPGFSEAERVHLFDSFYQANTPAAADGLGLGLALCERIISWHGGQIWAENRRPRGAIFNFTLPLENEGSTGENEV